MTKIHRVLVPINSHDPKAWQVALAYADKICEAGGGSVQNVVLLVHIKAQLNSTDLSRFIGTAQAKALDKGAALTLPSGAKLRCETLRTLRSLPGKGVVIAYWADMTMLDFVDGLRNLAGVVAVPEFDGEVKAWEERWAPIVHGRATEAAPTSMIEDPVVEKALETLNLLVNRSTGLGHPRDKEHAKEILASYETMGARPIRSGSNPGLSCAGGSPRVRRSSPPLPAKPSIRRRSPACQGSITRRSAIRGGGDTMRACAIQAFSQPAAASRLSELPPPPSPLAHPKPKIVVVSLAVEFRAQA